MSRYTIPPRPTSEDGFDFDSHLERDWAGFITHIGLQWRQEPFAVLRERGPAISKNIVARPDFFLPDVAVIFECKPTPAHVWDNEHRWRHEAARTGLPVVVTDSRPQPHWTEVGESMVRASRIFGIRDPERWVGTRTLMPPMMWTFRENGEALQTYFAGCPDCTAVGLLGLSPDVTEAWHESAPELWLTRCRHRPTWTNSELTDAICQPFPTAGRQDQGAA